MSPLSSRVVQRLTVVRDPLIPHQHCYSLVPHSALQVLPLRNKVEQEIQEVLLLFLVKANDALRIHRIHVQRLLLGDWMLNDDGVLFAKLSSLHDGIVAVLQLLHHAAVVGVDSSQTF